MSGVELYYCPKCRDVHEWDSEGQIDRCKDYKAPKIDFENIVRELASELTRKRNEQVLRVVFNKRGKQ